MKVALYYPWIYLKGGIERSMLELLRRTEHDFVIFTSHFEPENTFADFENYDVRLLKGVSVDRSMVSVLKAALTMGTQKIDLDGFDAYMVWCDGLGPLTLFSNKGLPSLTLVSTPLRPAYDPVYEEQAKSQRGVLGKLSYDIFKHVFRVVDRLAWKNFDIVISTSTEVTNRMVRNGLCKDDESLKIAYPGVDCSREIGDVSYDPFFLIAGRIMWTKNIQLAVEAFLKAQMPEGWKLVIAGFIDQKSEAYVEELKALFQGHESKVVIERNPSDETLNALYRDCSAVLFPPLNEDWGIVPLEAMLYSKAVIANGSGGPAESVADGETGILLKPEVDEWARAIERFAGNQELIISMGEAGRERVKQYDWEQFAKVVDEAIEESVIRQN